MRIKSLRVKNNFLGWELEEMHFTANLTLLVGGSGVGKTQILNAINDLKDIANGKSLNGFEWEVVFEINSDKEYRWEGEFEIGEEKKNLFQPRNKESVDRFTLLSEKLTDIQKNEFLIKRDKENTFFQNKSINLKLDSTKSMLYILKEENRINDIVNAFSTINLNDNTERNYLLSRMVSKPLNELKEQHKNLEDIKNSNQSIFIKLLLCSELNLNVIDVIGKRFIDIFPQIESIKIQDEISDRGIHILEFTLPMIYIKEKGGTKWITEEHISSGMLRTIIHIAELYLSNDGSIILIDEFENSLGVNCIDILTDDLIHERKDLQFIATSHHPYIINNIPYEYWKIVSRKGGKIQVRNAAAYKLGKSKQAAFIQLTKMIEKQAAAI